MLHVQVLCVRKYFTIYTDITIYHDWPYRGSSMTTDHQLEWPMVGGHAHAHLKTTNIQNGAWILRANRCMVCGALAFLYYCSAWAWRGEGKGEGVYCLGWESFAPSLQVGKWCYSTAIVPGFTKLWWIRFKFSSLPSLPPVLIDTTTPSLPLYLTESLYTHTHTVCGSKQWA